MLQESLSQERLVCDGNSRAAAGRKQITPGFEELAGSRHLAPAVRCPRASGSPVLGSAGSAPCPKVTAGIPPNTPCSVLSGSPAPSVLCS